MQAEATLEEMHARFVETKFAKMPVVWEVFDDIWGVVHAQDLLQIADTDLPKRKVKELIRAVLFVPRRSWLGDVEGDAQKGQSMAVVIDEYGSVAGIATVEDLLEEIVGEKRADEMKPSPDAVREADGSLVLRGQHDDLKTWKSCWGSLRGKFRRDGDDDRGMLSHVSGKVPRRRQGRSGGYRLRSAGGEPAQGAAAAGAAFAGDGANRSALVHLSPLFQVAGQFSITQVTRHFSANLVFNRRAARVIFSMESEANQK